MQTNIKNDLIEGAAAAAAALGLSKRQVYHMVAKKRLPCTRIGNRLYFRKSELSKAFSSANARKSGTYNDGAVSTLLNNLIEGSLAACQKI